MPTRLGNVLRRYEQLAGILALVPCTIAFASYRGAVVVAHEYGTALVVLTDLNRFSLYEQMRLPLPDDLEDERTTNKQLATVLSLDNVTADKREAEPAFLDFVHPPPTPLIIYGGSTGQQPPDGGKPSPTVDGDAG
jgi:hypothetical protein